jgi:hypothetical protein
MKKQILSGIILLFISKHNFSQTIIKDSIRSPKNEIGCDLIPLFKALSGNSGPFGNEKYSLLYKRQLKPHLYFRLSASIIENARNFYQHNNTRILFPETHINSGLEYRWGKKRLKYFTGMDLGYSYSKTTNSDDNFMSNYYTTKNGITITPFFGMQYHFSNRFFFSMQLGPEVGFINGKRQPNTNTIMMLPTNFKEYSLTGGILGNFSLFYKF